MSTRRGTQHRRKRNADVVAVVYAGCATADDLDDGHRQSHDQLLALAGRTRRSGVSWVDYTAADGIALLTKLTEADTPVIGSAGLEAGPGQYEGYLAFLREHPDGYLVVAMCAVSRPCHTGRVTR